jgi:hypothetical protein
VETRKSGSEGGLKKRASRKAGTALQSDPALNQSRREPLLIHLDKRQSEITDENRAEETRKYERDLAVALDSYRITNKETIKDKTKLFTYVCVLLGVQVVLWGIARLVA